MSTKSRMEQVAAAARQLDQLDRELADPLAAVSWHRDVIPVVPTEPQFPWALELKLAQLTPYYVEQVHLAMRLKFQLDVDEQVYYGDTMLGVPGLVELPEGHALLAGRCQGESLLAVAQERTPRIVLLSPTRYAEFVLAVKPKLSEQAIEKLAKVNFRPCKWLHFEFTHPGQDRPPRAVLYDGVEFGLQWPERELLCADDEDGAVLYGTLLEHDKTELRATYRASLGAVGGKRNVTYVDDFRW